MSTVAAPTRPWIPDTFAGYSAKEACELSGATYRQLDYWERCKFLSYSRTGAGSGSRRLLSVSDVLRIRALAIVSESQSTTNGSRSSSLEEASAIIRLSTDAELRQGITFVLSTRAKLVIDLTGAPV